MFFRLLSFASRSVATAATRCATLATIAIVVAAFARQLSFLVRELMAPTMGRDSVNYKPTPASLSFVLLFSSTSCVSTEANLNRVEQITWSSGSPCRLLVLPMVSFPKSYSLVRRPCDPCQRGSRNDPTCAHTNTHYLPV